jgi:hypothetical protein
VDDADRWIFPIQVNERTCKATTDCSGIPLNYRSTGYWAPMITTQLMPREPAIAGRGSNHDSNTFVQARGFRSLGVLSILQRLFGPSTRVPVCFDQRTLSYPAYFPGSASRLITLQPLLLPAFESMFCNATRLEFPQNSKHRQRPAPLSPPTRRIIRPLRPFSKSKDPV